MSIYINSTDVYSGSAYDGRFLLSGQASGPYILQEYNFEGSVSNWVSASNNSLYVYPTFDIMNVLGGGITITFGTINSSDPIDILAWFSAAWNQLVVAWSVLSFSFTVSYDQITDRYTTIFTSNTGSGLVTVGYLLPSEITNPELNGTGSTIASVFGWVPNGEGLLFNVPSAHIIISGANFGVPRFLEVYSPQITSRLYTSKNSNPSFIITTSDDIISGQYLNIPRPVDYIDLKIYKEGYINDTYSLSNNYHIILKPI